MLSLKAYYLSGLIQLHESEFQMLLSSASPTLNFCCLEPHESITHSHTAAAVRGPSLRMTATSEKSLHSHLCLLDLR
jgi:hypothetical protein